MFPHHQLLPRHPTKGLETKELHFAMLLDASCHDYEEWSRIRTTGAPKPSSLKPNPETTDLKPNDFNPNPQPQTQPRTPDYPLIHPTGDKGGYLITYTILRAPD